jgi:DNA-binding response OmpR family regulator
MQNWTISLYVMYSSDKEVAGRRILIVDDEAEIVSIFKMILEMNNFEVDGYTDPFSALANFKPNEFGLLILDIRMPVMDGYELFKKLKKYALLHHLKIFAKNSMSHLKC